MSRACLCVVVLGSFGAASAGEPVRIEAPSDASIQFAAGDLRAALTARGYEVDARPGAIRITAAIVGAPGLPRGSNVPEPAESFAITPRPGARQAHSTLIVASTLAIVFSTSAS